MRRAVTCCFLWAAHVLLVAHAFAADSDQFEMRVRPVLAKACYACHTDSAMGGLQLDSREHLLTGGKSGAAIVPGDPEGSKLIQAIRYTGARKMPPGGKLKEEEIASLEAWVKAGAVWPASSKPVTAAPYLISEAQRNFWAFRPVARVPVPAGQAKNEIDRFILARLDKEGMNPARPADKRTLIRRATLDLTGLPPTPEEVAAFEADRSSVAFATVVDRLLASSHYGERWGRYWLDVARYSDDKLNSTQEEPYPNAFRYRDWVIAAFNNDMPYDTFVKAQIAGDLLPEPEKYRAGLGFYALSPEFQDDRVDATTRGFLALTVACAQCHDHKFDPIPTRDYYSLLGIFANTKLHQTPLASSDVVADYDGKLKAVNQKEKALNEFAAEQARQLSDILAARTERYLFASAGLNNDDQLDSETVTRWKEYLKKPVKDHPFLKAWGLAKSPEEQRAAAREFGALVLAVSAEKKMVDDKNHITLGANPNRQDLSSANLVSVERDRYVLWEDIFGEKHGVLYYGLGKVDRFLSAAWKTHLDDMRSELASMKKELPAPYPFLHTIADNEKLNEQRVWLRGSRDNLGDAAPPHFLQILSKGEPKKFGKARLDLAGAIANKDNPLTARVMVNRVWQHHFGQGLVRTPSNFGLQGDTPSHPELLDFLAARFMDEGWSMKKLHREMMLSAAYQQSTEVSPANYEKDPENRLLWRFSRHRLDIEGLRDALLFVSGDLDKRDGGAPVKFGAENHARTAYGFVSRRKLDTVLGLFDFPNPNNTSDSRTETNVPLQRLFFMNSDFVQVESKALVARLAAAPSDAAKIDRVYRIVLQRAPTVDERKLGEAYVAAPDGGWVRYAQVLLSSNEFGFIE